MSRRFLKSVRLRNLEVPTLFASTEAGAERFIDFFVARNRRPHTTRQYFFAVAAFASWCEGHGVVALSQLAPHHVATYPNEMQLASSTTKLHRSALRAVFDWLVEGQILAANPARATANTGTTANRDFR